MGNRVIAILCGLMGSAVALAAFGAPIDPGRTIGPPHPVRIADREIDISKYADLKTDHGGKVAPGRPYVMLLTGSISKERAEQLHASGVHLGDMLSPTTWIVTLDIGAEKAVGKLAYVEWLSAFQPEWKLRAEIGAGPFKTPERQALAGRGEVHVIATLFAGKGSDATLAAIKSWKKSRVHYIEHFAGSEVISLTLAQDDLQMLAALDDVQAVEDAPELELRNSTNRWIVQSNQLDVTPFYTHGLTGAGQVVGITDAYVDVNHCSFFDSNPIGPTHRKILAYNTSQFVSLHGTHVAGIAVGDNGVNDDTRGIAYGGKLVYAPVPNPDETGIYNAFTLHHGQGARIHTNSWGNDATRAYDSLCRGIDSFMYDNEDDLVLFATSNSGQNTNPENTKNLLAIGATQDTPAQDLHCFGGTGPTIDGRRKPDMKAPGCNVYSSWGGSGCLTTVLNGTSMATPAAAASAMLVRQYYLDGFYPSGAAKPADSFVPSGALLKATLLNSAVDMTGIADYPNYLEGWGRVLLDNACYFSGDTRRTVIPADVRNASGMTTGQEFSTVIRVNASAEPLRATLVWTDPPASASTGNGSAWINDLDLELTSPSSAVYLGNVFSGGVSVTGGTKDGINNVEQVHLPTPETGLWTLKVKAAAVNVGTQGYSVVVSGRVFPNWSAPTVISILPGNGDAGSTVPITDLEGTGFQAGASVLLQRTGQPDVVGTSVVVVDSSHITCNLDLTGIVGGPWDVVVINPDGQQSVLTEGFFINLDCVKGDLNFDGNTDGLDVQRFIEILTGQPGDPVEHCAGDIANHRDGLIGLDDVQPFANCLLQGGCM